jgi:hypothetical protein
MPVYDTERFDPPAPMAQVTLRDPDNRVLRPDVLMLLDSGANVTLVPQTAVDALGVAIVPDRQYEPVGFDSSMSLAPVVRLELLFYGRTFRGQFLVIDRAWGILGRNVLNAVSIVLDGPSLVWDEHRPG